MTEHWKGRGIAAAAIGRKAAANPKPPRNYVGEAVEALAKQPALREDHIGTMLGAIIVAQAIDRLIEKVGESAAVINYKRV